MAKVSDLLHSTQTNNPHGVTASQTGVNKVYVDGLNVNADQVDGNDATTFMYRSNNLNDVANTATAKSNLNLNNVLNKAQLTKDGSEAATGPLDMNSNPVNDAPFSINNTGAGNHTFVASDAGKLVTGNDSSTQTFTIPDGTFSVGTVLTIMQKGSSKITFSTATGQTINNRQGHTQTAGQYAIVALTQYTTDTWVLTGDTA